MSTFRALLQSPRPDDPAAHMSLLGELMYQVPYDLERTRFTCPRNYAQCNCNVWGLKLVLLSCELCYGWQPITFKICARCKFLFCCRSRTEMTPSARRSLVASSMYAL